MITAVIRYPGKKGTHETEKQFASVETKHIVVKGNRRESYTDSKNRVSDVLRV